jgi:peptide/nickel transport system permease protein
MLEVIRLDYIRTAHAKGASRLVVLARHAFKNAVLPIITLAGLHLPQMFSGALVTETVFSWPGIGRLYFDSLNARDYPVLLGILLVISVLVVVGSLLADLGYALVDPRIRHGVEHGRR